ncbi:hypothetical protein GCM10010275_44690 [Streptomyces litmocidini]|nr:hypothetical protein GCM10010275_44690 [Streptomyces litmocidini]
MPSEFGTSPAAEAPEQAEASRESGTSSAAADRRKDFTIVSSGTADRWIGGSVGRWGGGSMDRWGGGSVGGGSVDQWVGGAGRG